MNERQFINFNFFKIYQNQRPFSQIRVSLSIRIYKKFQNENLLQS